MFETIEPGRLHIVILVGDDPTTPHDLLGKKHNFIAEMKMLCLLQISKHVSRRLSKGSSPWECRLES